MRLLEYLHDEQDYPSEVIEYIVENVNINFLKELNKVEKFVYRGSNTYFKTETYKVKDRNMDDREPTALHQYIHDKFNLYSLKKFGWKIRNGVFTTGNIENAEIFGDAYLFFPISDYKFLWSTKIEDVNFEDKYEQYSSPNWAIFGLDDRDKQIIDKNVISDIKTYKNTNLEGAVNSGHEIIFNCKKYILVNLHYEEQYKEYYHWKSRRIKW